MPVRLQDGDSIQDSIHGPKASTSLAKLAKAESKQARERSWTSVEDEAYGSGSDQDYVNDSTTTSSDGSDSDSDGSIVDVVDHGLALLERFPKLFAPLQKRIQKKGRVWMHTRNDTHKAFLEHDDEGRGLVIEASFERALRSLKICGSENVVRQVMAMVGKELRVPANNRIAYFPFVEALHHVHAHDRPMGHRVAAKIDAGQREKKVMSSSQNAHARRRHRRWVLHCSEEGRRRYVEALDKSTGLRRDRCSLNRTEHTTKLSLENDSEDDDDNASSSPAARARMLARKQLRVVFSAMHRAVRSGRRLMGHTLTDTMAVFVAMDKDRDGLLSRAEFVSGCSRMGLGLTETLFDKIFAVMDKDHSGFIEYWEFLRAMSSEDRRRHRANGVRAARGNSKAGSEARYGGRRRRDEQAEGGQNSVTDKVHYAGMTMGGTMSTTMLTAGEAKSRATATNWQDRKRQLSKAEKLDFGHQVTPVSEIMKRAEELRRRLLRSILRPSDALFNTYDTRRKGYLNRDTFCKLIRHLRPNLNRRQIWNFFSHIDPNNDGRITVDEFQVVHHTVIKWAIASLLRHTLMCKLTVSDTGFADGGVANDVRRTFKSCDTGGAGFLRIQQLAKALQRLGLALNRKQAGMVYDALVETVEDKTGREWTGVNYHSLMSLIQNPETEFGKVTVLDVTAELLAVAAFKNNVQRQSLRKKGKDVDTFLKQRKMRRQERKKRQEDARMAAEVSVINQLISGDLSSGNRSKGGIQPFPLTDRAKRPVRRGSMASTTASRARRHSNKLKERMGRIGRNSMTGQKKEKKGGRKRDRRPSTRKNVSRSGEHVAQHHAAMTIQTGCRGRLARKRVARLRKKRRETGRDGATRAKFSAIANSADIYGEPLFPAKAKKGNRRRSGSTPTKAKTTNGAARARNRGGVISGSRPTSNRSKTARARSRGGK